MPSGDRGDGLFTGKSAKKGTCFRGSFGTDAMTFPPLDSQGARLPSPRGEKVLQGVDEHPVRRNVDNAKGHCAGGDASNLLRSWWKRTLPPRTLRVAPTGSPRTQLLAGHHLAFAHTHRPGGNAIVTGADHPSGGPPPAPLQTRQATRGGLGTRPIPG